MEINFRWPTTNIHKKIYVICIGRKLRTSLKLFWRLDSSPVSLRKDLKIAQRYLNAE
jgi:hypothetical protein